MLPIAGSFRFDYGDCEIVYGRNCIRQISDQLANHGFERALLVCGTHVASNEALMGPIRDALSDIIVTVFDETTPAKSAETVYDGISELRRTNPDVLIGIGGGSSLDVARQMSAFAADGRSLSELRTSARNGDFDVIDPDGSPTSVITVPTTFAGAGLSSGGSIEILPVSDSSTSHPFRASGRIMPEAVFYDPNLFETTPMKALTGSAMNGFNKGIETIYSPTVTTITDGTAVHGLRLLQEAFPRLRKDDSTSMERAVQGSILVQFHRKTSVIHAFGHGFSQRYPIHQGIVHAILGPHVLRYILDEVDARRSLLAEGLDIDNAASAETGMSEAIIDAVVEIRDTLDLPTRLRDLQAVAKDDFPAIAEFNLDDESMQHAPAALDPTTDDIETILQKAW